MSEVGQAPPSGVDQLPARPPSEPSRVPLFIWVGIAVFCLLTFGAAVGMYLWWCEAWSAKDLKQATSVKISYVTRRNQVESVAVEGAELQALLDSLKVTDTQPGGIRFALTSGGAVDFTLPDGKVAQTRFVTQE